MGKDVDLIQAVRDEDLNAVIKILNKTRGQKSKLIGSVRKCNVNFQDASGMSALHQAALTGNCDVIKTLLEHGAVVDITDSKGLRPVHYAAWQGKDSVVELLLQHGCDVNEAATDGNTPLHLASEHGHFTVVKKLLDCGANPTLTNQHHRTPLDVACEFGRIRVVEFLLDSELTASLLVTSRAEDTVDNDRTTCLHLAARNGHVDIIRLLLEAGVDINRQTLQGTCLHEAAMFGKTDVVTLLLSSGVDVNRLNSYEQTALEVVNKFTATRGAREIKQLLKEASSNVRARAVKDYSNSRDGTHIAFKEGDLITVTEQHPTSGLWKGFKCTYNGVMTRPGYFPATAVVLLDPHLCERKSVLPNPVTDGSWLRRHHHSSTAANRHTTDGFALPPSPLAKNKNSISDSGAENGLSRHATQLQSSHAHSLSVQSSLTPFSDAARSKDSPGASSHGSGTASCPGGYQMACQACNGGTTPLQHRLSGQSCESGVSSSSRQSYHSGASTESSSSQGSLDRLEESGYCSTISVHELLQQGLTDREVLRTWLTGLHLDEFYELFVVAGYDMPTISRMTPEDLTAIGITRPSVRKKLKSEIGKLTISDGIPDYQPNDICEWLSLLHLSEYTDTLLRQGYSNLDVVTDITWEDLEEIGIKKLGHQKKIMLGIDRLKRLNGSLHRPAASSRNWSTDGHHSAAEACCVMLPMSAPPAALAGPSSSCNGPLTLSSDCCGGVSVTENSGDVIVSEHVTSSAPASSVACQSVTRGVVGAVVNVSSRGVSAPSTGSRAVESDGDVTPTNERKALCVSRNVNNRLTDNVASVPRPAAYVIPSPKPAVIVPANTVSQEVNEKCSEMSTNTNTESAKNSDNIAFNYGTLPRKFSQKRKLAAASGAQYIADCYDVISNKTFADTTESNAKQAPTTTELSSVTHEGHKEPPVPPKRTHSFRTEIRAPILNMRAASVVPVTSCQDSCGLSRPDSSSYVTSTDLFIGSENSLNEVIERLERGTSTRRNPGPRLGDWQDGRTSNDSSSEDSDSGLDSRRSDSSTSLASCGGSADTNTLPFANENVGTIKQRGASAKTSIVSPSDSGNVQLNGDLFTGDTSAPAAGTNNNTASPVVVEADTVFNDIDGMLLGLTAELDEMLKLQV